jgi:arylsulfatase
VPQFQPKIFACLPPLLLLACGTEPPGDTGTPTAEQRPNVLLIVVDDMGYNEIGAFGSEIDTPNLDELAFGGLRFTNFHAAPSCAPARAMLLSGTSNHQAGVGSMTIKRAYDAGRAPNPDTLGFGLPGYVGHLSERVAALPEILQAVGYHTYMTGKWDLGRALEDTHMPAKRGFESSFILTTGTAIHLGFPDRNASGGLPRADSHPYQENGVPVTELPENFVSSMMYTDKLIEYIDENTGDGRPFFAWLSYTVPHSPIQVQDDWRDRYAGRYDEGYEVIRDRRFAKAQELGIFPADLDLSRYDSGAVEWSALSDDERREQSRVMELYAAMLENMDFHVGRLIAYLDETGQLENTVILFMSDNGAAGGGIPAPPTYPPDNSFDNMGRYNSWLNYGRGWAEAATAPFRGTKGSMAEGGTRSTAFIHHGAIADPGGLDHGYLTFMDIAPTILDITGTEAPSGTFAGREIVPMMGKSFWGRALGSPEPTHGPNDAVGAELHGNRTLVRGDWKILLPAATGQWELFNLVADIGETNDLADQQPELLADLVEAWERFAADAGVAY